MSPPLPSFLAKVQITSLPDSAFYIPDFITASEEEYLLNKITTQPLTTWRILSHRRLQVYPSALSPSGELRKAPLPPWLEEPFISRLLSLQLPPQSPSDGSPDPSSSSSSSSSTHLFHLSPHHRPNHILINEYPSATGISPHEDGAAYHPLVATISLASHTVLDLYDKDERGRQRGAEPRWRVLQERRSLLVTMGDVYCGMLHGIADAEVDCGLVEGRVENWGLLREETRQACAEGEGCLRRGLRISATVRDVRRVRDYDRLLPRLGGRRV